MKLEEILSHLISIQAYSGEEEKKAEYVHGYLDKLGCEVFRDRNNVWAYSSSWVEGRITVLLNSHLDTVKPVSSYTFDPHEAKIENGKLYGLGSNDAGGALVCLMKAFEETQALELNFNLVFLASAEEENSGRNGMEYIFPKLPIIDLAIVGEPTQMKVATSERGLMVLDIYVSGVSGHAARDEGENALLKCLSYVQEIQELKFSKYSDELGEVKVTPTVMNTGIQHNVIPDLASLILDVRSNGEYDNLEIVERIEAIDPEVEVVPRSTRLNSSSLEKEHFFWEVINELGLETFGSSTLSDQALMNCSSVKIGPGDSARSHTANEYILLGELERGLKGYMIILETLNNYLK